MRRIALVVLTLALVAAACGDDDGASASTVAATTASTEAPATTATPTTTAAATTVPPTTEAAINPLLEAALELQGTHNGQWNNTTFGSSGTIELTIAVDEAAEVASVSLDLGGLVFGGDDPDPLLYEFDLSVGDPSVDVYEFTLPNDGVFGGGTLTFEGTDFRLDAPSVPGVGGLEMIVEGFFTQTGMEGTYTIVGLAEGTLEIVAGL